MKTIYNYSQSDYDRTSTHTICSKVAYLIGVREHHFYEDTPENPRHLYREIFDELERNKHAKILRCLCSLRTDIIRNFKTINNAGFYMGTSLIGMPDLVDVSCIDYLEQQNIRLGFNRRTSNYVIEINKYISDRVNNCRNLFPSWLPWDYLKDLFLMPNGRQESGTKDAASLYYENRDIYPYQAYINWIPEDAKNILRSDMYFLSLLYEWNGDVFENINAVTEIGKETRDNIHQFLVDSKKPVIMVDCENANPYNFYSVLHNLDRSQYEKIEEIILVDGNYNNAAWDIIASEYNFRAKHSQIDRVLRHKSLVDIALSVETCRAFFERGADSFLLVSSDSDYWGLITCLPEAKFLVMMERERCSQHIKDSLQSENIFYCFTEDFPSDDAEELKDKVIAKELKKSFKLNGNINLDNTLDEVLELTQANYSDDARKALRNRIVQSLKVEVTADGEIVLDFSWKK